jgi:hypothetical protein
MKIAIVIKNRIDDWLEHVYILYTSNKELKNQIEHLLKML